MNIEPVTARDLCCCRSHSPEIALWKRDNPATTPSLNFGRAWHLLLLDSELFLSTVFQKPVFGRSKEEREKKGEWESSLPEDAILLSAEDYEKLSQMCDRIISHPFLRDLFEGAELNRTREWVDDKTGLRCVSRVDLYRDGLLVDFRSSSNPNPEDYPWGEYGARRIGAHIAEAHHSAGLSSEGKPVEQSYLVVQLKTEPYTPVIYRLDESLRKEGRDLRHACLAELKTAKESGRARSWADGVHTLSAEPAG